MNLAPNIPEGAVTPATLTFNNTNSSVWRYVDIVGVDDPVDDGPSTYNIVATASSAPVNAAFTGSGTAVSLTNLDDDLLAQGVGNRNVMEDSGYNNINITLRDSDHGGNGSWAIQVGSTSVTKGQGEIGAVFLRTVDFRPAPDWFGDYEIQYTIVNEHGKTSTAKSGGNVLPVPDKPVAVGDGAAACQENGFVDIPNVVGNDTDIDNWPIDLPLNTGLTIASVTATGGMAVKINGDTGIKFTPTPGMNSVRNPGAFSVTYFVKDAEGNVSTNSSTIPITVTPRNARPRANGDGIAVDEDSSVIHPLQADGGEFDEYANQVLTYAMFIPPARGSFDFETMTYTPDPDYDGDDSFWYYVTDDDQAGPEDNLSSDPVQVLIAINPVNDAPTAGDDGGEADEDTSVQIEVVFESDADIDSTTLTVVDAGEMWSGISEAGGTVSGGGTTVSYTPPLNFNGTDSFWYVVSDGELTATAWVTVAVAAVNDAPTLDETHTGYVDSDYPNTSAAVAGSDVDEDAWYVVSIGTASHGNPSFDGNDVYYEYTDFTYTGFDTFAVTSTDGNGEYAYGTVYVLCYGDEENLNASGSPRGNAADLASGSLPAIVAEARARWQATGADTSILDTADFRLADLSGSSWAAVVSGAVLIDRDAAGFGWFVDASPEDNREFRQISSTEFRARRSSDAFGRMDLLTAIIHEMGHLLGEDHADSGLMADTLAAGMRKVPTGELA